jgi:hypothetical protein
VAAEIDERVTADRSWMTWTLVGVAAIWIGVIAVSLVAPDLVSGSEHEHLPLAGFLSWIWGLVATLGLLWGMGKLRGSVRRERLWIGLVIAVAIIWGVAVVISAAMPAWETGTDPTELPVWAIVAPLAAALLTVLGSVIVGLFSEAPSGSTSTS